MPESQRASALREGRSELEANRDLTDKTEIEKLIINFENRLSFMKMTTVKSVGSQQGVTRLIYRNGEKVDRATPRDKARHTNWDGGNMDPDSVTRHYAGLKRAGFKDNAHAKGVF